MRTPCIRIYCMGSWGELGNRLAAQVLSHLVCEACPDAHVEVRAIEEICPIFAAIGEDIRRLTLESRGPGERARRYLDLFNRLAETHFPPELELGSATPVVSSDVQQLGAALAATSADLVVGTKGVIARMLLGASRGLASPPTVINHVTNRGLLALPLHRAAHPAMHLVPFEADRQVMVEIHGYDPSRIAVIGPLVAGPHLGDALAGGVNDGEQERSGAGPARVPVVLIFANRDGRQYLELLETLGRARPDSEVIFVGLNDPAAVAEAEAIAVRHGAAAWRWHVRLPQPDFLRAIRRISSAPQGFMICKPGPNTILEAVHLGIPCVILDSGLPMERWVCDFVREHQIGAVCPDPASLADTVLCLLRKPDRVRHHKTRVRRLARRLFDRDRSRAALSEALRKVFAADVVAARSGSPRISGQSSTFPPARAGLPHYWKPP